MIKWIVIIIPPIGLPSVAYANGDEEAARRIACLRKNDRAGDRVILARAIDEIVINQTLEWKSTA